MRRTRQPRGAVAKTKAAADKARARRDAQAIVDRMLAESEIKNPLRPSILSEVAAGIAKRSWSFTPEQIADIAEVRAAVAAGTIPRVGRERLARILKERYDLPWSVSSIIEHIKDTP